MSGIISYLIFNILQRKILYAMSPIDATRKFMPLLIAIVFGTFSLSLLLNGLENLHFQLHFISVFGISLTVALFAAALAFLYYRKMIPDRVACSISVPSTNTILSLDKAMKHLQRVQVSTYNETHETVGKLVDQMQVLSTQLRNETGFTARTSDFQIVEKMFIFLQILSACFVAFAHGANDVANAVGPIAAVLDILKNGSISETTVVPSWILTLGGLGIVIGLATWGWRVIITIGKKITELTPTRGFCAEFGAATTILVASKLGLPVSTTHCLVGAVLGVGLAKGIRAINLNTLKEIVLSWVITIPMSALMSILIYYGLKSLIL